MSRVRLVFAAVLAVSVLAVLALPASASVSVPAANVAKVCKPIESIQEDLQDAGSDASSLQRDTLKKFASALKASGKHAPAKVKKAANTMASFYSGLATGDVDALANATKFGRALTVYFTYIGTHCS